VSVKAISVTKLATAALLFGAVAIGCAGHNGGAAQSTGTPAVQQSQVAGTAPTLEPITSDAPSDSPESSAATDPGATGRPGFHDGPDRHRTLADREPVERRQRLPLGRRRRPVRWRIDPQEVATGHSHSVPDTRR